jgi:hypothetical protein
MKSLYHRGHVVGFRVSQSMEYDREQKTENQRQASRGSDENESL